MRPEKRPPGNRPLRNPHVTVLSGDRLYLLFGVEGWMSTVDVLLTEMLEDGTAVLRAEPTLHIDDQIELRSIAEEVSPDPARRRNHVEQVCIAAAQNRQRLIPCGLLAFQRSIGHLVQERPQVVCHADHHVTKEGASPICQWTCELRVLGWPTGAGPAATGASTAAACADRKAHRSALGSRCPGCRRPHPLGRRTTSQNGGHRPRGRSAERILFESSGQVRGLRGTTGQAAVEGRDCLWCGGSGSDFAEEPVVRCRAGH